VAVLKCSKVAELKCPNNLFGFVLEGILVNVKIGGIFLVERFA
jgi:hypothetical protein